MLTEFFFQLNTRTYYGIGCSVKYVKEIIKENNYRNIGIIVDEGVAAGSQYFGDFIEGIKDDACNFHTEILRGSEEPDYDYLDTIVDKLRVKPKFDVLVGIGGGSGLDTTKAIAMLLNNPGKGIEYRGFDKAKVPGVPVIAIPSTGGTASEVTINAVFINKNEQLKFGINGRFMNATYAILDTKWTVSCPLSVAVSAGMDALVHTLESFSCDRANSLTRVFSKEAFRLLYKNLPSLVNDPDSIEAKQNILLGSYLAGIGLFNSGSGIAGAFSYPLGVHYKVPHGIGGGIFLVPVIEYNVKNGYLGYAELLDLVETHPCFTLEEKSRRFAEIMRELSDNLGVPKYLDAWGVTKEQLPQVEKLIIEDMQPAYDQNPVPFKAETDAVEMIRKHIR